MTKKPDPIDLPTEGYAALLLRPDGPDAPGYRAEVFGPDGQRVYRSPVVEDLAKAQDVAERYAEAHAQSVENLNREKSERALELVPWLSKAEDRIDDLKAHRTEINAQIKAIELERRQRIEDAFSPQMSLSFVVDPHAQHGEAEEDDGTEDGHLSEDNDKAEATIAACTSTEQLDTWRAQEVERGETLETSPILQAIEARAEELAQAPAWPDKLPRKGAEAMDLVFRCDSAEQLEQWLEHENGLKRPRRGVIDSLTKRVDELDSATLGGASETTSTGLDPSDVDWPSDTATA